MKQISTGSPFESSVGYSRAMSKGGWCFVSRVTGYHYATMEISPDVASQGRACFSTIDRVLREAGFSMSDIVRVQHTVVDASLVEALVPVPGGIRPATTMVIADLIRSEILVEIEVTAFKG